MQRIATLKEGDWIEETYLAVGKTVLIAKNGVTYLSVRLADKTGEIDGKLWDNAEEVAKRFNREDFVRIRGVAANYQGQMQVKMKGLEKVDDDKVDLANFLETSPRNLDEMTVSLRVIADSISNGHLRCLMQAFLGDDDFMPSFRKAPAAKTLHHNYIGGLMEHVLELISLCRDVAKHFPGLDTDLLTVGAFLHDIGKVRELEIRKSIGYTTEGRLLGHISLGYEMLSAKIAVLPSFPEELAVLLKHIMLSHHGEYEFGSPKRPKIQEAIIINYLDDLAAKINNFRQTIKKECVGEGDWTGYSKMHERCLYRQAPYDVPKTGECGPALHGKGRKDKKESDETKTTAGSLPLDL